MNALTPFRFVAILLFLEAAYAAVSMARAPRGDAFLIGDCPYYAATTISLVSDGDWDLRNQLPGDLEDHEGFFALSKDERIVPKHSTLMPILSIPFYIAFGKIGFLLFNLIQVFFLIVGIAALAGNGAGARLLALVGYLSTPFLAYTFNYSPDILCAVSIVWSYFFARRKRPILCGLLAGLAIWAKVYAALLVLPLALIVLPLGWRAAIFSVLAGFLALAPMLVINAHLFGAPWITGYDRDARITPEGFTVTEHYSRFNQPLIIGLDHLLFDERIGLLRTAPLWFLWPLGLGMAWRGSERKVHLAITLALLFNVLFFARYDEWDASVFGNRFLFPAVALGFALQGVLWQKAVARISG